MIVRGSRIRASHLNSAVRINRNTILVTGLRANRRLLDIQRGAAQIRGLRSNRARVDHQPLFASGLELLHVADARRALGLVAVLHEVRDRNSGQNGDDGDHDHDFNEGKTLQEVFHGCVPFFVFVYLCRHHADTKSDRQTACQDLLCLNKTHFIAEYMRLSSSLSFLAFLHK